MLKQMIKGVPLVHRRCLYSPRTSLTEFGNIRRLFSTSNGNNDDKVIESIANVRNSYEGASSSTKAQPKLSLCQINNHPDFRLQLAKARLANSGRSISDSSPSKDTNNTTFVIENKIRSNDGTSSGALVDDRLRLARRKALENASQPIIQPSSSSNADKSIPTSISTKFETTSNNDIKYSTIENPIRSNDGTSSGAVSADRLRLARRKASENASQPIQSSSSKVDKSIPQSISPKTCKSNRIQEVREHNINITTLQNTIKKNDGTSSGAKAADRLRLARENAIDKMKRSPN